MINKSITKYMKTTLSIFTLLIGLFVIQTSLAQSIGSLRGIIKKENGEPLAGINISLENTTTGSSTDGDGKFLIQNIPVGNYNLIVSGIGYTTITKRVAIESNKVLEINFSLNENTQELEEVVVTAAQAKRYGDTLASQSLRINTPLIETPQNISVITKATMKDFGINGTGDMARLVSGVSKWYGGANDFSYLIRGMDATNNNFRDGMGGYWWNQQADAFMLEKVEFVKGPAGFMIGNAEPGGVYNEVTKQADGEKIREVELGYGSFNLMRAGADVGGKFSNKSKFSYRLVVGGQYSNANYDFYKSSRLYVMPSLRYTYAEGSNVQIEYIKMNGFSNFASVGQASFNGSDYLYPAKFNATEPKAVKGIDNEDSYVRISHTHQFKNGWHWKTQLADARGRYEGDGMYSSGFTINFDTVFREYYYIKTRNFLTAAQSFVDGKFSTGSKIEHSFLTGVDYGKSTQNTINKWLNPDGYGTNLPLPVYHPEYKITQADLTNIVSNDSKNRTTWLAWYGQDHIKFYDKMVLTLAGRYSYTEAFNSGENTTAYNWTFTPRLGLTYLINKAMSVYVLYDKAFVPQNARLEDGSLPKPLIAVNKEIGYKAQLFKNRLFINSSVWHTEKNNVLVQNPQTTFYEQRGQITSQGFEMSAIGYISKSIMVNVNYTYLDAKITEDPNPENIGYRNSATSKHTANAMLIYRFIKGKLSGLSAGAGVQFIGAMNVAYPGSTAVIDKDKTAPRYALFDANLAYDIKKFSFHLNVYNLFNKKYMVYPYWNSAIDGGTRGYYTLTPGDPTNFRISAGYKF